jgi:cell division protein ZapB
LASAGAPARANRRDPRPARCSLCGIPAIFGRRSALEHSLLAISARVDRLLDLCRSLQDENRSLRSSQEQLANERAQLLARNEQARSRVEAMIMRLKSLEQNQA